MTGQRSTELCRGLKRIFFPIRGLILVTLRSPNGREGETVATLPGEPISELRCRLSPSLCICGDVLAFVVVETSEGTL